MIEINLDSIKCPMCKKHSYLKMIYDETTKLYYFRCGRCKLESANKYTDSMNLFKNFSLLKWNKKN